MDKHRFSAIMKKFFVAASVAVVAVILVVSALTLVKNARVRQTMAPQVASAVGSELRVVPSSAESLSATTDTDASSTLQGAVSSPNPQSNELPNQSAVQVDPLPATGDEVCDSSQKARLLDMFATSKANENKYHTKMLSMLKLENILLRSSELTRHTAELAKLEANLTKNLSAIYCSN